MPARAILRAMERPDADLIRDTYEEWGQGNLATSILHPDVEVVWADGMLDTSVDRGIDEFVGTVRQYTDVVSDPRIVAHEIHQRQNDFVVLAEFIGTGKESGVPTTTPVTHVWELKDGRAVRITGHFGHRRELLADGG